MKEGLEKELDDIQIVKIPPISDSKPVPLNQMLEASRNLPADEEGNIHVSYYNPQGKKIIIALMKDNSSNVGSSLAFESPFKRGPMNVSEYQQAARLGQYKHMVHIDKVSAITELVRKEMNLTFPLPPKDIDVYNYNVHEEAPKKLTQAEINRQWKPKFEELSKLPITQPNFPKMDKNASTLDVLCAVMDGLFAHGL